LAGKYQRVTDGKEPDRSFFLRLVLLTLFFSAGVVLGRVLSGRSPDGTSDELVQYLTSYLSLGQQAAPTAETFLSALLLYCRYPFLACLLGFASVGVLLLPAVSAAFGFFLSFSVCCFTAAFGRQGVLLAFCVFGIRCLITIPCYFIAAIPALENSYRLAVLSFGRGRHLGRAQYGSGWWLRMGTIALILLAGALSELFLTPQLLQFALSRILS